MIAPQQISAAKLQRGSYCFRTRSRGASKRGSAALLRRASEQEEGAPSTSAPKEPAATLGQQPSLPYKAIIALASLGAAETTYLTAAKLLQADVVCPSSGCASVLSSDYSSLFGQPLPLYGMLAYTTVAALAVAADKQQAQQQEVPRALTMALSLGIVLVSSCSAFLMYILQARLGGEACTWCYTSAAISFALLATLVGRAERRQLQDMAGPGLGLAAAAMLTLYLNLGPANQSAAEDFQLPYAPPLVTEQSSSQSLKLARRLRDAGAKMYGAFWCSHCFDQKQTFGAQAMSDFPYVECYPEGWQRGVQIAPACDAAGVKAFPTWVINGRTLEGQLSLEELEQELGRAEGQQAAAAAEAP